MKTKFVGQMLIAGLMLMPVSIIQNPVLAQPTALSVPVGTDRLLRANTTTEVASGKTLQIDGVLRVAGQSKATLKLQDRSWVQGQGTINVEPGSTLVIDSAQGTLGALKVINRGNIVIKGQMAASAGLDFRSSGKVTLDGPVVSNSGDASKWKAAVKAVYPNTGAKFTIENGGLLTGTGVLNGDLSVEAGGKVLLAPKQNSSIATVKAPALVKDSTGKSVLRKPATPAASPDYLLVTGDYSGNAYVFEVHMNSTYYGQLAVAQNVTVNNCTLNVILDNYTPAYANAFRIIRAPNVTGTMASFNSTALNFDNRGIITVSSSEMAYRLSGY